MPEVGTHWFCTYHNYHTKKLKLQQSSYNPCLLSTFNNNIQAIIRLQTDNTLLTCNIIFKDKEQEELKKAQFLAKPLQKLTINSPLEFNGIILIKSPKDNITIS